MAQANAIKCEYESKQNAIELRAYPHHLHHHRHRHHRRAVTIFTNQFSHPENRHFESMTGTILIESCYCYLFNKTCDLVWQIMACFLGKITFKANLTTRSALLLPLSVRYLQQCFFSFASCKCAIHCTVLSSWYIYFIGIKMKSS